MNARTDDAGQFHFDAVPIGEYTVAIVDANFVADQQSVAVLSGTAPILHFELRLPVQSETVVVSAAAGGVGSVAGQIAKIHGCHAIGIAGADDKIRHIVNDLGFDAAFNYREGGIYAKLRGAAPDELRRQLGLSGQV